MRPSWSECGHQPNPGWPLCLGGTTRVGGEPRLRRSGAKRDSRTSAGRARAEGAYEEARRLSRPSLPDLPAPFALEEHGRPQQPPQKTQLEFTFANSTTF